MQAIVTLITALQKKITGLSKRKENMDQSVLFHPAQKYFDCLMLKQSEFEQLLEDENQQWIYQSRIAKDRLQSLVKDLDAGLNQHVLKTGDHLTHVTNFS